MSHSPPEIRVPQPHPNHHRDYSPCHDAAGLQYHLVTIWGQHPHLKGAALRVHGISYVSLDLAHAAALDAWSHAYVSLDPSRRSRRDKTRASDADTPS